MEIFTFFCYANKKSDDVIGGSSKTVQHSITNISGNIKAVFFKLQEKENATCPTVATATVMPLALF